MGHYSSEWTVEEEGVRPTFGFFPSVAIALLRTLSEFDVTPPSASRVSCASEWVCQYIAGRNRRRRGPFNNGKQGGERYDWRTEKSFFPLSRALPFRIIPSRMLFHLVRVVPSFPIAHDWLQGGMKKGAELRASTILPPPSLGKIGAQQKANYAKQWKKERKGRRQAGGSFGK